MQYQYTMANGQHDLESILAACLSPDNMRRAQAESALKVCSCLCIHKHWRWACTKICLHHDVKVQMNRRPSLLAGIVQAARHPGDAADDREAVGECGSAPSGITDSAEKLETALAPAFQGGRATTATW